MPAMSVHRLTSAQQRLWIIHRLNPLSTAYNAPVVRTLRGKVDPRRLEQALLRLVQRHEQLRATFSLYGTEPMQAIHEVSSFELVYLENVAAKDVSKKITNFIRPFALDEAPLLRAALLRVSDFAEHEASHVLVMDIHHVVCDLGSEDILVRDLFRLYHNMPLPEIRGSYGSQVETGAEHSAADEEFWLSKFAGELPVLQLPADHRRPTVFDFRGTIRHFPMGTRRTKKLRAFATSRGVPLPDVAMTAVFVLLAKYGFQEDLVIGTPHEVRPCDELAEVVGMFMNTLPIRANASPDKTARAFLAEVSDAVREGRLHSRYDVRCLVEKLGPTRDPSRNPLYDVLFFHQSLQTQVYDDLEVAPRQFIHEKAEFDLTFGLLEVDDRLDFSIEFATSIFDSSTIQRMAKHYCAVVDALIDSPAGDLADIDILSAGERKRIASFNDTARPYPWKTLDRLFVEQVARSPEDPALRHRNKTIDYRELDERANRVANMLRSQGAKTGDVVALWADPSLNVVAGVLGILKAECAYLPISPDLPPARIAQMLQSSSAKLLVAEHGPIQDLDFEIVDLKLAERYPAHPQPLRERDPSAVACVLYTSGSTGEPKGALVRHFNVVRTVVDSNYLVIHPSDRLLQLASLAFDASLMEVFGALLNGATLILVDSDSRGDLSRIATLLENERVSVTFMTTALFNAMVDEKLDALVGLRKILTGGERASADHMRKAVMRLGPGKLLHLYGPTESTFSTTYFPVSDVAVDATSVPVGYPLSNTRVLILNGRSQVPLGVSGELCIAGDGLAAGYLDEDLTAQKFVSIAGERVYRTGDVAKWRDDGTVEFLGRMDWQVKIRGMRIEPGEIEAVLQSYPGVKEAAVIVRVNKQGEKCLQAFCTRAADASLTSEELTAHARRHLPGYMVPTTLFVVDAMPLDRNGKIDRRRLPSAAPEAVVVHAEQPPLTEAEQTIAVIWSEILDCPVVNVSRSFFDCGGHSLTAAILSSRLEQAFEVPVPLHEIFEHPTIAGLAVHLAVPSRASRRHRTRIPRNPRLPEYPLSFSERMVYAHQHTTKWNHSYNNIFPMLIEGPLDIEKVENAIRAVVQRHEAFRSGFVVRNGVPVKIVVERVDFRLARAEGTESAVPVVASQLRADYDLASPPLFRASLLTVGEQRHILIVANHHIVSDGVTEAMFMREISQLYRGAKLEPCPLQYTDFTLWQQREWECGNYGPQEQYWLLQLQGPLPLLELPLDFPRPPEASFDGHTVTIRLGSEQTVRLRDLAKAHHTTLFVSLLAAYTVLLHKYSGQEDLIVGIPVANRMHGDLQSVAGMFVNMVPVRTNPQPDAAFSDYLESVKKKALSAIEHQDYPFDRMVRLAQGERDPSRNPLFDTIFAFQSTGPAVLDIEGLRIEPYPLADASAKVDLTVEAFECADEVRLSFTYATGLFQESTIRRMAESLVQLISDVVVNPAKPLRMLTWLPTSGAGSGVGVANSSALCPRETSLFQLFEESVRRYPRHVAVRFQDEVLTYLDLHTRAEAMAARLLDLGARPGEPVALMTARSVDMVVGIWSILRLGGAYVPIDPGYPRERIQSILRDSGARVCLTEAMIRAAQDAEADISVLPVLGPPVAPAYIMYTSGSTGAPKGVAVGHRNVIRTVMGADYLTIKPEDNILQLVNYVFDLSVFDIFGALLNGATLVLAEQEDATDPGRVAAVIDKTGITIVTIATALFNAYIDYEPTIFAPLRKVLFGGEPASTAHVKKAFTHLGPGILVNVYGPTEVTVISNSHTVNSVDDIVPIGRPVPNTTLYVLDANRQQLPVGVPGELYIGGDGVSQGYWGDPKLTCQRFVPDPSAPGAVMYKSGDLVKWQEDGELVFLGRIDQQIKLRGFRVEPAEIEARLAEHPLIGQCAVVMKGDQLIAYYVSAERLDETLLKTHLRTTLPHYMVPGHLVQLSNLPLTPNGKVDRHELTTYFKTPTQPKAHIAPETPVERLLVAIWRKALERDEVGIDDNFYALGGHSLKALEIVSLLQQGGHTLSASDLFRHPTIRELAHTVRPLITEAAASIRSDPYNGFGLSAVQHRFFQRDLVDRNVFNSPFLIALNERVEPDVVEDAVRRIVHKHPILTARFEERAAGEWRQIYQELGSERCVARVDLGSVPLTEHDATISARCAALQREFDLSKGHLYRVVLFENYQDRHSQVLFFLFHHLVFDRTSWGVFVDEFRRHCADEPISPSRSISYFDWCLRLDRYADRGLSPEAAAHWQTVVGRGEAFLPDKRPRSYALQKEMVHHATHLLSTADHVSSLDRAVESYQANAFHLLLAAFSHACHDLQPRATLPLYVMSAQRESFFDDADITQSIGFFAGAFPVCIDISSDGHPPQTVENVKEALLSTPRGGLDYFMLRFMPPFRGRYDSLDHPYPMLFHYVDNRERTARGFSTPLEIPVGLTHSPDNPSAYLMNVTAVLESAALKLTIYYSRAHFRATTAQKLSQSFAKHLQHVICPENPPRDAQ